MNQYLRILAKLVECLSHTYLDKDEVRAIATQTGIDILTINLDGSPVDRWWNVIQYCAYSEGNQLAQLLKNAQEDNPQRTCLQEISLQPIQEATRGITTQKENDIITPSIDYSEERPPPAPPIPIPTPVTKNIDTLKKELRTFQVEGELKKALELLIEVLAENSDLSSIAYIRLGNLNQLLKAEAKGTAINPTFQKAQISDALDYIIQNLKEKDLNIPTSSTTDIALNEKAYQLFLLFKSSLSIGLFYNPSLEQYFTGILIAADSVLLPAHALTNIKDIAQYRILFKDERNGTAKNVQFSGDKAWFDSHQKLVVLQLQIPLFSIPPLAIQYNVDILSIAVEDIHLLYFSNRQKTMTQLLYLSRLHKKLTYTPLANDLLPGTPLLYREKVIGVHLGKGEEGILL